MSVKRKNINLRRFMSVVVVKYGFILLKVPIHFSEKI
jgi:hypothetical protein